MISVSKVIKVGIPHGMSDEHIKTVDKQLRLYFQYVNRYYTAELNPDQKFQMLELKRFSSIELKTVDVAISFPRECDAKEFRHIDDWPNHYDASLFLTTNIEKCTVAAEVQSDELSFAPALIRAIITDVLKLKLGNSISAKKELK